MFDVLYRNARTRVSGLARSMTGEQLATLVAGSPEWNARQVVSHVVGVAADFVSGNLDGVTKPHWTAAQVNARQGRSVAELIAEWDQVGPVLEAALAERRYGAKSVFDLLTHECDLRETFGLGRPPDGEIEIVAHSLAEGRVQVYDGPGTLVVRVGGHELTGGGGEPKIFLTVEPYEVFRGLLSRRSRRQMRAWQWDGGDPGELVELLPVFGARDDDQPVPSRTPA